MLGVLGGLWLAAAAHGQTVGTGVANYNTGGDWRDCQNHSSIAGTAGFENARSANETNALVYGATGYLQSTVWPQLMAAQDRAEDDGKWHGAGGYRFRTTAGATYMDGPPAPDALVAQMRPADPLISRCPRLQDRALTRHLITRIHGPETVFDFKTLSTLWEQEGLHRDWLMLGCELLLKRGYFEVADARPLRLVLTERGVSLRDHAMGRVSRLRDRLAVKQAVDDLHEALGQAD